MGYMVLAFIFLYTNPHLVCNVVNIMLTAFMTFSLVPSLRWVDLKAQVIGIEWTH